MDTGRSARTASAQPSDGAGSAAAPLSGKTALVTGASRGLGFALAAELAELGADLVMCSRNEVRLAAACAELQQTHPNLDVRGYPTDVADSAAVRELFQHVERRGRGLHICVNNAGLMAKQSFLGMTDEHWHTVIDQNLTSHFYVSREAFRLMAQNDEHNTILNVASLSGIRGVEKFPGMAPYIASKHAIVGLTESLAVEGRPYTISANAIAPGAVDTEMLQATFPDCRGVPPKEVAQLAMALCRVDRPPITTGTVLEVFCNDGPDFFEK